MGLQQEVVEPQGVVVGQWEVVVVAVEVAEAEVVKAEVVEAEVVKAEVVEAVGE